MKRAPIIEDWSRFNRAVLDVADNLPQLVARNQPVSQPPKRDPPEPADAGDPHGLIAHQKWRKLA